jgi:predicted lipid-binding transport protein (Tim44 family)
MNRNTISAAVPPHWWERLKGAQFGLVAGLLIGMLLGWFFHGIISMAVRLGFLVLLLLPLIVIGWLWLRSQRSSGTNQAGQPPASMTWTTVGSVTTTRPPANAPPVAPDFETGTLIDVPVVKPRAESRPDDIEAELQALKRQQERGA